MEPDKNSKPKNPWIKILIVVLVLVAGVTIISLTPIGAYLADVKRVKSDIEAAGIWGFLIFIALFVFAALFNIPELGFLFMAYIIYDQIWVAALLNYVSGMLSAIATFYAGRMIGSGALHEIKNVRIKNLIASAENNPIKSIAIMRTIMLLNPIVGYTLSLTKMKPRDYIIGNLVGIAIPVLYLSIGMYFMKESLMRFFGIEI
jgi:uncharacterized membrane protein YdjX (TVP38/TMEM64 family)